jgi:uncharacterized phiE125 gp8 family phage protein
VPEALRSAVLMIVADLYEYRESEVVGTTAGALPFGVPALIAPFRRVGF